MSLAKASKDCFRASDQETPCQWTNPHSRKIQPDKLTTSNYTDGFVINAWPVYYKIIPIFRPPDRNHRDVAIFKYTDQIARNTASHHPNDVLARQAGLQMLAIVNRWSYP